MTGSGILRNGIPFFVESVLVGDGENDVFEASLSVARLDDLTGLGWNSPEELTAAFESVRKFMEVGYHPQGNPFASAAAVFEGVVKLEKIVRRKPKAVGA